jgi:hypothetical protein
MSLPFSFVLRLCAPVDRILVPVSSMGRGGAVVYTLLGWEGGLSHRLKTTVFKVQKVMILECLGVGLHREQC